MVRIGWMQDAHNRADPNDPGPGPQGRMVNDIDWLTANGASDIYWTGDMVDHPEGEPDRIPHTDSDEWDRFWELMDTANDPDAIRALIPGNHDVPLQPFLKSDPRCVLRKRIDYEDAGVSVFLINTQATGWSTGSAGVDNQAGPATEIPRVPYSDIKWLDEQMADAGSNTKIVFGHAAPYGLQGNAGGLQLEKGSIPNEGAASYRIIQNWEALWNVLSSYNKVVYPISHLYNYDNEGSITVDGVDLIWKYHYYQSGGDNLYSFGRIDATDTSITVDLIDHSTKSVKNVLDKTF